MKSLNCHFSEMLLNAEVSQFIIGDYFVSVSVIPENISGHIGKLVLVFFQESAQSILDLNLIEFLVMICIEWNQKLQDSGSDSFRKSIV